MRFAPIALAALAFTLGAAQAQQTPADKAAAAAESWLKLVDAGSDQEAYEASAQTWKKRNTIDWWKRTVRVYRRDRGPVSGRQLVSVEKPKQRGEEKEKEKGPKTNILVARFDTKFEKGNTIEIVTLEEEGTEEWRVAHYAIGAK